MNNNLQYLSDLEMNNNREWYQANKTQYTGANAEFERLIQNLIDSIGQTDASIILGVPKELTFKLNRDTRFSHDKSPYNPTFRAHISSSGKLPVPCGYFLFLRPGNRSYLGGGLFASMFKDATAMIRDYIVGHGSELEAIVNEKGFSERFAIKGEALKRVPAGYDVNHPQAEYLKFKSWYLEYPISDDFILSDAFIEQATRVFRLVGNTSRLNREHGSVFAGTGISLLGTASILVAVSLFFTETPNGEAALSL
jgi:uncharacterized protein (TIGR02453 family)